MRTTRVPAQLMVDFNAGDGIPSWHFNDDAEMLNPALWTAAELYQNRGRSEGDAVTAQLDGDYGFGDTALRRYRRLPAACQLRRIPAPPQFRRPQSEFQSHG